MSASRVSLRASEVDEDGNLTEVVLAIDREDEPDEELREQVMLLTPYEMEAFYRRLQAYYEWGTWSRELVER